MTDVATFDFYNWPAKWFGVWREHGETYAKFPSVHQFRVPHVDILEDKELISEYLRSGNIIAVTSRLSFLHPITESHASGTIAYRTDGVWLWLDDLAEYVRDFGVSPPLELLRQIRNMNYEVAPYDGDGDELDWPSNYGIL